MAPESLHYRFPAATYRLQFNSEFRFPDATHLVPYLRDLGITHCYASPLFRAAPGSTHGYDVCSFEGLNPVLGSAQEFQEFLAALRENQMGLILDMVPNHMATDWSNDWWRNVLEWGPRSRFASYFDIDWQPLNSSIRDKVVLPVLEDNLEKVLESGKLQLGFDLGGFYVGYHAHRFPLAPESYGRVLNSALAQLNEADDDLQTGLRQISAGFEEVALRPENLTLLQQQLNQVEQHSKPFRRALSSALESLQAAPAELESLLQQQHYSLAFWRSGCEEINYRRFFDVTSLICLRMEASEVFVAGHALLLQLLAEGHISGLRIDHPDGLWDPKAYFDRLRAASLEKPCYIVAEKILTGSETLREDWPVHGTTGYDFLNAVNGLFIDLRNEERFNEIYRKLTGKERTFPATTYAGKKRVLEKSFVSEVNALTHRLVAIAALQASSQELTVAQLRRALVEVVACFPVYRTYLTAQSDEPSAAERAYIEEAIAEARRHGVATDVSFDFIRALLLTVSSRSPLHGERARVRGENGNACPNFHRDFILKFQQLTAPAAAKGVEDTAFYRYNRLISLNEVGGDPARFGTSVQEFHAHNQRQAKQWPHTMLATATHDAKRGEDVRATINVLSEMPTEWEQAITRWRDLNAQRKATASGKPAPDLNDEYFLYQTLVGAWPGEMTGSELEQFRERIVAYMLKATREAKLHTNWLAPNAEYEHATQAFIEGVLDQYNQPFLRDFSAFQTRIAFFGRLNSLSQLLLKITSPGVPDFYQGTELWNLSLVDPDNRRPVDYTIREHLLAQIPAGVGYAAPPTFSPSPLKGERAGVKGETVPNAPQSYLRIDSGQIKMFVMQRALQFRQTHRNLFDHGEYVPLEVVGAKREHICAFARVYHSHAVLAVVPRLCWSLTQGEPKLPMGDDVWQDTRISLRGISTNEFSNGLTDTKVVLGAGRPEISVAQVLSSFPVAFLSSA